MWIYDGKEVTDEDVQHYVAYVYLITNKISGRKYIGKKRLIKKTSRKPLKGKKRKRVSYGASDWRDYFGSNDELLKDVEELGKENFSREILVFCKTLGASSYIEAKFQFITDCIIDPNYYNVWISCRSRKEHLKGIDHEGIRKGQRLLQGSDSSLPSKDST